MHLVTGKAGSAHITAENHRRLHAGALGSGRYVLTVGSCLAATIATANSVEIADGVLIMDGAQIEVEPNTTETVAIDSATAGYYRHDIIAVSYAKDGSGYESASFEVVAGTEAATEAAAVLPTVTEGNILDGDTTALMPLYDVLVIGTSISTCTLIAEQREAIYNKIDELEDDIADMAAAKAIAEGIEGNYVINGLPTVLSVDLPTINAGAQSSKVTANVTLNSGSDKFIAVPMDGGYIITNGFTYSQSGRTVSFWPINTATRAITGTFRALIISLKEVSAS